MKPNIINRLRNIISILKCFYCIQLIVIICALVYYLLINFGLINRHYNLHPSIIMGLLLVMAIINGFLIFKDNDLFKRLTIETESRNDAFKNVEKLNRDLRAQRHDFLNHIQVLYSLMELEEYEETRIYLNRLYGDIIKVGNRIKTDCVSINALLQAKSNEAEKRGIKLEIFLKSRLEQVPMGDWELCRILGNLIDNAFEALEGSNVDDKLITIQIFEAIKSIEIRVRNNGPYIPEKLRHKIFEAGVSTKEDSADHGMGLYIVKDLLEENGHKIQLEQEGDVCFHISLIK